MKKMNEKAMKAVNGGGYYRCVCGRKFYYDWSFAIRAAILFDFHMKNCTQGGSQLWKEMYG